jgi:translation elongation factor EF-G
MEGLKKLNKSDPSVDVYIESTGDIILNTCGEVHL